MSAPSDSTTAAAATAVVALPGLQHEQMPGYYTLFHARCLSHDGTGGDDDEGGLSFYFWARFESEDDSGNYEAWDYSHDELSSLANAYVPEGFAIDDVIEPERSATEMDDSGPLVALPAAWAEYKAAQAAKKAANRKKRAASAVAAAKPADDDAPVGEKEAKRVCVCV